MTYSPLDRPEHLPVVFAEAWNRRDPATLAALFDEDADFVNVVGLWWRNRAAIQKAHAYGLTRIFDRSTLQVVRTTVKWLSDSIAIVHARMRLTGQTPLPPVAAPGVRTNIFTFVVHQTAEGWRCAAAHNTDVVPGVETHVVDAAGRLGAVDYRER